MEIKQDGLFCNFDDSSKSRQVKFEWHATSLDVQETGNPFEKLCEEETKYHFSKLIQMVGDDLIGYKRDICVPEWQWYLMQNHKFMST